MPKEKKTYGRDPRASSSWMPAEGAPGGRRRLTGRREAARGPVVNVAWVGLGPLVGWLGLP